MRYAKFCDVKFSITHPNNYHCCSCCCFFELDEDLLITLSNGVVGILHTIIFHRALGLVRPKDVDLELFDITYVRFQFQFFFVSIMIVDNLII